MPLHLGSRHACFGRVWLAFSTGIVAGRAMLIRDFASLSIPEKACECSLSSPSSHVRVTTSDSASQEQQIVGLDCQGCQTSCLSETRWRGCANLLRGCMKSKYMCASRSHRYVCFVQPSICVCCQPSHPHGDYEHSSRQPPARIDGLLHLARIRSVLCPGRSNQQSRQSRIDIPFRFECSFPPSTGDSTKVTTTHLHTARNCPDTADHHSSSPSPPHAPQ